MNTPSSAFDAWIRGRFPELNTALEELYFAQTDRADTRLAGVDIKAELLAQGNEHMRRLLAEGNTDQGFDRGFDVLGNLGLFMAACERHGITQQAGEAQSALPEASALAMQLGASLGVTPRFATSHLATHNRTSSSACYECRHTRHARPIPTAQLSQRDSTAPPTPAPAPPPHRRIADRRTDSRGLPDGTTHLPVCP